MMAERSSGELVGSISLFKTDWEARSSEVGYGVRPDRRGRGYASEAAAAVARWALTEGGMQRIQLTAVTGNLPSLRVAEKAGFQREGTLRRAQLEDDGLHDLAVFSLLDDDPAVQPARDHMIPPGDLDTGNGHVIGKPEMNAERTPSRAWLVTRPSRRARAFYKDLHQHPELSHAEHRTAGRVLGKLQDMASRSIRAPAAPE